jgi:peptide/nickel transport system permease protein
VTLVAPPPVSAEAAVPPVADEHTLSRGKLVWRRFRRDKTALFGVGLLVSLFLAAYVGPHLTQWEYDEADYTAFLRPPSGDHWFGTTQTGFDVFAQTMRGMQKSLLVGILVALVSGVLAAGVGLVAGYKGGIVDRLLMWNVDLLLVLPSFLIIAIVSTRARSSSWIVLVFLLALFSWMISSRLIRAMTLSLKELDYVKAARYMGVSTPAILWRHVLPNLASILIIDTTLAVGLAVLAEAGLSFFGFGVQPPDVSLGTLIRDGSDSATTSPWLFAFSAGALVLIGIAVNLMGEGLRRALDPHTPQSGS